MANGRFDVYAENVLGGGAHGGTRVDFDADTIKAVLVDAADDTLDITVDEDLADLVAGARVSTATISGFTNTNGVLDATDTTFTSVTGDQSEHVYIYKDTGVESTSLMIVKFDTFSSGMPVTPNGGNIVLQYNASGIFTI